jgi:hypothetical protein
VILYPAVTPQISIDGGNAATMPQHVALRIDFGLGGASINPEGLQT